MTTFLERVESLMREMIREEIRAVLDERKTAILDGPTPKPINDTQTEQLLKAEEVAEILGVSKARVYELARRRKANGFPVITIGDRQYRFSRKQLNAWLDRVNTE